MRVIARDGKFLGNDVGGASITIRDAHTRELLAKGTTSGSSGINGPGGVMCARLQRGEPIPLQFVATADTPGQFAGTWDQPLPGSHEITVYAHQKATGNTGVATAAIVIPG